MRKILFILFGIVTIGACGAAAYVTRHTQMHGKVTKAIESPPPERLEGIETPEEDTECQDIIPEKTPESDVRLVGRLAKGMRDIRPDGIWNHCGQRLDHDQKIEISVNIAYNVVLNARSVGLDGVSVWGVLATAYHESKLDACALGLRPRVWAYENGLLKKNRKTWISHTKVEVLGVVNNPKAKRAYKKSGFDLGYCQILSRFYRGQEADMLSEKNGMRLCVLEMKKRARHHKTKTPWLFWRSIRGVPKYRSRIQRYAKKLGATVEELRNI